jgi:hypothetical protein
MPDSTYSTALYAAIFFKSSWVRITETDEEGEEGMRRPASMAAFAEEMKWGQGMAILVRRKREKGGGGGGGGGNEIN